MPAPIRAVIFDFGGVICFHPTDEQIAEAAAACDLKPADFLSAFWKNRLAYDGGLDPYIYWRGVAESAARTFDDTLITSMIAREIDFWSNFDQRLLAWTSQLREAGIRTGILSNLPSPLGKRLRQGQLLEHFDHVTFSYELNVVKPQREIYEDSIRGLGIHPSEGLFLDDREENIAGAQATGLQTDLYTTWENFDPTQYALPTSL